MTATDLPNGKSQETGSEKEGGHPSTVGVTEKEEWKPDYRFWLIFVSLTISCFLCGLENSIIVTPLPFIVRDLNVGSSYVWVANIHFLTGAAVLPVLGQLANLFGRRHLTLFVLCLYTLGSGLCGGAINAAMFLVGRALQGAGGSGILMITEIIMADLAPVKARAAFIGMIMGIAGIGSIVGPSMGGAIVQNASWRWVFYLNLPICAIAIAAIFVFLRVKWNRSETIAAKLARFDWGGNLIMMASTISVTIAFTWAGSVYPWASVEVLAPLILGLVGLAAFLFYETLPFVREPLLPLRLFNNRTSITIFINTFLSNALLYYTYFFIPVYYQAVLRSEPMRAAVLMLPLSLLCVPTIVLSTAVLSKYGRYKWLHVAGFAVWIVAFAAMSLLEVNDSPAKYICVQIPGALAVGLLIATMLPAFQGAAAEEDQAAATASWTWIRAVSYVWGVSIASVIFNKFLASAALQVEDPAVQAMLRDGGAFSLATKSFVDQYQDPVRLQIQIAFNTAFKKVMQVAIAFTGLGFFMALIEKDIALRTEIETEFGLEERTMKLSNA
ncbi:major facilitator superfamily domain-containing protein [Coniochaeta sp. 2T2.1]|nr:major facilitator superfamily domain-containing protein [Coniochaeta sp. 2T2.1]